MIFDETNDTENPAESDVVSDAETAAAPEEQAPAADEAPEAEAAAEAVEHAGTQVAPKEIGRQGRWATVLRRRRAA